MQVGQGNPVRFGETHILSSTGTSRRHSRCATRPSGPEQLGRFDSGCGSTGSGAVGLGGAAQQAQGGRLRVWTSKAHGPFLQSEFLGSFGDRASGPATNRSGPSIHQFVVAVLVIARGL